MFQPIKYTTTPILWPRAMVERIATVTTKTPTIDGLRPCTKPGKHAIQNVFNTLLNILLKPYHVLVSSFACSFMRFPLNRYRAQRLSSLARRLADAMALGPHPRPAPPWPSVAFPSHRAAARQNENRILAATARQMPVCAPVAFGLTPTTSGNSSNSSSSSTGTNNSCVHLPFPGAESALVAAFDPTTTALANVGGAPLTSIHSSPLRVPPRAASTPTSPASMFGVSSPARDGGPTSLLRQHAKTHHEVLHKLLIH